MVVIERDPDARRPDEFHRRLVICLDPAEARLPRASQRHLARYLGTRQMADEGYEPAMTTHPHAQMLADGTWEVAGWWRPARGDDAAGAI